MRNTLREIEAVAGEGAEAGEIRLVLEFESPGERAIEVHAVFFGEEVFAGERGGGVARIHGAVAVAELGSLTGSAALGIGLADDDGFSFQLGDGGDHGEAGVDGAELIGDAHADVAIDEGRRTLGVEGEEVGGRAGLAGGVVFT